MMALPPVFFAGLAGFAGGLEVGGFFILFAT
jgi:hypothetical protein